MLKALALTAFFLTTAFGLGLYVFPDRPYLAWGLLFLCWACFRLKLRADRLFRSRSVVTTESGRKGGEVRRSVSAGEQDSTYARWRRSGHHSETP